MPVERTKSLGSIVVYEPARMRTACAYARTTERAIGRRSARASTTDLRYERLVGTCLVP